MPEEVLRTSEVSVVVSWSTESSSIGFAQVSCPFSPSFAKTKQKTPQVPLSKDKENTWVNKSNEINI